MGDLLADTLAFLYCFSTAVVQQLYSSCTAEGNQ
jgi:hypothetical protein